MRILTVRQPWAWAIIHGGKNIENRSRNIAGTYRGPVAIHAGLAFDNHAADTSPFTQAWHEVWPTKSPSTCSPRIVPQGAIIGVVDLVDVHLSDCLRFTEGGPMGLHLYCTPWGVATHHHLVLNNPRALATPIPVKGKLGLWRPDPALAAQIEAALAGDSE